VKYFSGAAGCSEGKEIHRPQRHPHQLFERNQNTDFNSLMRIHLNSNITEKKARHKRQHIDRKIPRR
jgi:hypothetical protein